MKGLSPETKKTVDNNEVSVLCGCPQNRDRLYLPYISSNNSRGRLFYFFSHKKGAIIRGRAIIKGRRLFQILFTGSRALDILFYFPFNRKNNHIKYTEHGLFKCYKFSFLINFHSLNGHWSVLLDHITLELDREGIKRREDGDYFKYFCQRGAIIRGRRLIEGRLLFEEIR